MAVLVLLGFVNLGVVAHDVFVIGGVTAIGDGACPRRVGWQVRGQLGFVMPFTHVSVEITLVLGQVSAGQTFMENDFAQA